MTDPWYHSDERRFRDALAFSAAEHGFVERLIEKDYYCSLVLQDLAPLFGLGLTFKGGTSLSKVHAGFYRLSEDLDFVIHVSATITRSQRRQLIEPVKRHIQELPSRMAFFDDPVEFTGHKQSAQYIGTLTYQSRVSGETEQIKLEIGLREPIVQPRECLPAHALLVDPDRRQPAINPVLVHTLSRQETYSEKVRAALSRSEPAIRDFFDLAHAIRNGLLIADNETIALAARKLRVSGHDAIDLSAARLHALEKQLLPQLRSVLRDSDYESFDLKSTFELVCQLYEQIRLHI